MCTFQSHTLSAYDAFNIYFGMSHVQHLDEDWKIQDSLRWLKNLNVDEGLGGKTVRIFAERQTRANFLNKSLVALRLGLIIKKTQKKYL